MAVKPGYTNPLAEMRKQKNGMQLPALPQKNQSDPVRDLQLRRQTAQNQLLLLKSTSDGAGVSQEPQELLEQQIEELTTELNAAKVQKAQGTEKMTLTATQAHDIYEKGAETWSAGVYWLDFEEDAGYQVQFSPYLDK